MPGGTIPLSPPPFRPPRPGNLSGCWPAHGSPPSRLPWRIACVEAVPTCQSFRRSRGEGGQTFEPDSPCQAGKLDLLSFPVASFFVAFGWRSRTLFGGPSSRLPWGVEETMVATGGVFGAGSCRPGALERDSMTHPRQSARARCMSLIRSAKIQPLAAAHS